MNHIQQSSRHGSHQLQHPDHPIMEQELLMSPIRPISGTDIIGALYHWLTWCFIFGVLIAQLLGITGFSIVEDVPTNYGQSVKLGKYQIPSPNDLPLTDRCIVCVKTGNVYEPLQVRKALNRDIVETISTNGTNIDGYRVIERNTLPDLAADAYKHYSSQCNVLAKTMDTLLDSCEAVGYKPTRGQDVGLRLVDDIDSTTMKWIPDVLPVLIRPYFDNSLWSMHIFPGEDGNACIADLSGSYRDSRIAQPLMSIMDREQRTQKVEELLEVTGGKWRNGWYEEPGINGDKYFAEFVNQGNDTQMQLGLSTHFFDTHGKKPVEVDCQSNQTLCMSPPEKFQTGPFTVIEQIQWTEWVLIDNGHRFGFAEVNFITKRTVTSKYDLETFLSNLSMGLVLLRWFVSMGALHNGYRLGVTSWFNTGIGSLSCARSYNMMPVMMAPRLTMLFVALFVIGHEYQGRMKGIADSWFFMYPSIAAFVLFYFSILNIIAKTFFRRFTDKGFAPTLLILCLMHRFRKELCTSGWFEGAEDGRVQSLLDDASFEALTPQDFLFGDAAMKVSGNITALIYVKLIVLGVNLLPLLFSQGMTTNSKMSTKYAPCDVERTLAIRASHVGGLGKSPIYEELSYQVTPVLPPSDHDPKGNEMHPWTELYHNGGYKPHYDVEIVGLNSYEIMRLGYVVFGGTYLMTFDDWYIVSSLAPLRFVDKLWNHRVTVFQITRREEGFFASPNAELCRVDDPKLLSIPFYDVCVCGFR